MKWQSLLVAAVLLTLPGCQDQPEPTAPAVAGPSFYNTTEGYWEVNNTLDHDDGFCEAHTIGHDCTLREAITVAAPGDEIRFSFTTDETIVLADELVIDKSLSINGKPGVEVTVSGNTTSRVFWIDGTDSTTAPVVEISRLTIQDGSGDCGGGIRAQNVDLYLQDVIVTGNNATYGGGICHYATGTHASSVQLIRTTVTTNNATESGGGIHNFQGPGAVAVLIVDGSPVIGNHSTYSGGGIHNLGGTVTVRYSTIESNGAGALVAGTFGGGIDTEAGTVEVYNSTIWHNQAPSAGGIFSNAANVWIENSTITANSAYGPAGWGTGGGILNEGALTLVYATITGNVAGTGGGIYHYDNALTELHATILADNTAHTSGPDLVRADVTEIIEAGYSLVGIAYDGTGLMISSPYPNLLGTTTAPVDPGLLPLADNGGATWTHALETAPASPAIDFVACGQILAATDQRLVSRPQGVACDIGAFESATVPPNTPTGAGVEVTPVDGTTGSAGPVTITYDLVTAEGVTTVQSGEQSYAPAGFALGDPPTYFDIETTADFTGPITICIDYAAVAYADITQLKLLHYNAGIGHWEDVTTFVDPAMEKVCGTVESLSPFLVAQYLYTWAGFFPPVENPPAWNETKAGSVVPLKFSLGGDFGTELDGLAVEWQAVVCPTKQERKAGIPPTPFGDVYPATPNQPLAYDDASDVYKWEWRTERDWRKSCLQLLVTLPGETTEQTHKAWFKID